MSPNSRRQTLQRAIAHHQAGRLPEAEMLYREILAADPNSVDAIHLLGVIALQSGSHETAANLIARAVALAPKRAEFHSNLGETYRQLGRRVEATASLQRAVALQPNFPAALINLGAVYQEQLQFDDAVKVYRRALALDPKHAVAHNNLGEAFKECGRIDEALASFQRAVALNPGYIGAHSNFVLSLLYRTDQPGVIDEALREWNRQHAAHLAASLAPHPNDRSSERRLRVGYVSPDFHDHVVGRNLLPLFQHHAHDQFEIFAYAQAPRNDAVTRLIQAGCDHWRDITALSDEALADQIRHDGIDLLVDLAIHTAYHRLLVFARKPAPVQVSFAAYPGRSGLDTVDYHLTDAFLVPPASERSGGPDAPWRLPASFWCYEGMTSERPVGPLPATSAGRVTFGCLNTFSKCNPTTLQLWVQVLLAVPDSRLLLLCPEGHTRVRTLGEFQQAGVAVERIEFVGRQSREDYLALYGRIDVGLDTFPYNGHTTSLDSYWMGVPVVTLVGTTAVSRAGVSQWSNLGSTDFVAKTPDDYVRIATKLAGNLPRLAELRAGLRDRMKKSPLMDGINFTRQIEAAYRRMWRKWCETSGLR